MPKTQPETHIRNAVRNALIADGWFVFYVMQGMGCYPGIADLCAAKRGRTVWLEIKTAVGKQSPEQISFEKSIKSSGGEYRIARGLTDVADLLDQRMIGA